MVISPVITSLFTPEVLLASGVMELPLTPSGLIDNKGSSLQVTALETTSIRCLRPSITDLYSYIDTEDSQFIA